MIEQNKGILLLIFMLLSVGCTSLKKSYDYANFQKKLAIHNEELNSIYYESTIQISFDNNNQQISGKIYISEMDSILFNISGPLSIPIAKFYSDKDKFVFYNIMANEYLEGKPDISSLSASTFIPLEYSDLLHILRCEPLFSDSQYKLSDTDTAGSKILFLTNSTDFIDYVLFSIEENAIVQYQRKNKSGENQLTILYRDFKDYEGIKLPQKISIRFPDLNGFINVTNNKIKVNENFSFPFKFKVPEGVKKVEFE